MKFQRFTRPRFLDEFAVLKETKRSGEHFENEFSGEAQLGNSEAQKIFL